jgi:hypothetical protein
MLFVSWTQQLYALVVVHGRNSDATSSAPLSCFAFLLATLTSTAIILYAGVTRHSNYVQFS